MVKKKIMALACCAALMMSNMVVYAEETEASVGSEAEKLSGPVELKLLDSFLENLSEPDVIALNIQIDKFIENHPDITITRDQSSADVIDTKVPTLAAANELPDMFACRSSWVSNFAAADQLMTIEDLFADDPSFIDGFKSGMLDDFTYNDKVYGIPWRSVTNFLMYYNMDMLREAGIEKAPETYEELKEAVEAVKEMGVIPIALGDKGKWCSRMWFSGLAVRTAGTDYLEKLKAGEMKFTDPEIVKAISIIDELADMGTFNEDFTSIDFLQARQLYYDKKAAMYGEMVIFAQVEDQQWPEDLKSATVMNFFPGIDGEDISQNVAAPVSCGWGMAFNANLSGDKLIAARMFAEEVLGDEYNKVLVENAGIAVRPADDADLSNIPDAVIFYNENIAPRIIGGGHIDNRMPGGVTDTAAASLQEMILGLKTPEEVAQDMQDALEKASVL